MHRDGEREKERERGVCVAASGAMTDFCARRVGESTSRVYRGRRGGRRGGGREFVRASRKPPAQT